MTNNMDDNEKTNLIVNYLPQQMTDGEFEDLFKKFGDMKSCKIVRHRNSGQSYGFGFVDFQSHEQALKAIDELNGHELERKKIKVAFARPAGQDIKQANLYIKNVPNSWSQDDVKKVFEPYGNIIQVRVLGNDRGVAFVLYDLRKQAEDALEALNGKTVEGCDKPFEIKFAADKKVNEKGGSYKSSPTNGDSTRQRTRGHSRGRGGNFNRSNKDFQRQGRPRQNEDSASGPDDRQQNQFNAIPYGGGLQYPSTYNNMNGIGPVRQTNVNRMNRYAPFIPVQQTLNPIVAPMATMAPNPTYGYPTQAMIPFGMPAQQMAPVQQTIPQTGQMAPTQMGMYAPQMTPAGYTQVAQANMSNIYSVASDNMNNAANMQTQIGQQMTMKKEYNSSSNNDDGTTLFVYNIGPDSDENELRSMFSAYGQVTKCNVVRKTPGGETKGFGFVTMRDRDQASSAIAGLNGTLKNGRALQVSLKK